MATPREIFNQKSKYLDDREQKLKRKVTAAEKKLLSVILDSFIDKLSVDGGVIKNNERNIKLTQALEEIFREFDKQINKRVIEGYADDILKGQTLSEQYFREFEPNNKKFKNIKKKVQETTRRRLGINSRGGVSRGGFLDNFIKDSKVKTQVQELATRAITGEQSLREAKQQLRQIVVGNDKITGQLQAQYRTFIYDTYHQIDALEASTYAEAIGMQSAYYLGGVIKTTRQFCCQRNGQLFTVDEIKKWQNLSWAGKNSPYNPLTDRGGYNCRHRYRYISNQIAVQQRGDLRLDKNGNLKKIAGKAAPTLNKC